MLVNIDVTKSFRRALRTAFLACLQAVSSNVYEMTFSQVLSLVYISLSYFGSIQHIHMKPLVKTKQSLEQILEARFGSHGKRKCCLEASDSWTVTLAFPAFTQAPPWGWMTIGSYRRCPRAVI